MITILFFIFLALVVFHFIYDGILAPSFRLEQRLSLFSIRDELRFLKLENEDEFSDELFDRLQNNVNKQISILHEFSITGIVQAAKAIRNKDDAYQRHQRFQKLLNNCSIEKVSELHRNTVMNFIGSVCINSGGWTVYIVPFLFVGIFALLCLSKVTYIATRILETPTPELQNIFGDGDLRQKARYI